MNALDQAFIKAFAKDRTPAAIAQRKATELHAQSQPPADGVESVSLVLHHLYQQGKRLRIDRPSSDSIGLDAHMILPLVEHVESYDPEDVPRATQPSVVFEDRLTPLDQVGDSANQPRKADRTIAASTRQAVELDECVAEPESNVKLRTDANVDTEVPTLDLPSSDDQRDVEPQEVADDPGAAEEQVSAEEQLLSQCLPQVHLAATQLEAPELMTRELGQLDPGAMLPPDATVAEIEILLPELDLDALEACVRDLQAVDENGSGAEVADVVEASLDQEESTVVAEPPEQLEASVCTAEPPTASPATHTDVGSEPVEIPNPEPIAAKLAASVDTPTRPPLAPFAPAWEVDAFRWPELCQQLDEKTDGRLTQSGDELFVATQDGLKVLAVTSSNRLEGRTTLALSLAQNAARAGSRVALVDADSANPELARRLGMEAPCDWREVVGRGEPLSEAAVASLDDRITLFPSTSSRDGEPNSFDKLLLTTLSELGKYFDLVVVDLPPVELGETNVVRARVPCPVDMVVVMRNVQATSQEQTLATVTAMRRLGVRAVGVIENFTQPGDTC